jgi:hypothetical protein
MRNSKGFTIIEVLVAGILGALVISSSVSFLFYLFSEKNRLDTWSSGQIEMSMAIKNIERDIRNVVRIEPPEDLSAAKDDLYLGLTSVPVRETPSVCLNDSKHSVIRYTTMGRSSYQAKSVRSWSELASAENKMPSDELRVAADNTDADLFSDKNLPSEILAVDADRRFIRRYRVLSRTHHLNSSTDPYDDAGKTDVDGNPVTFNYASVYLGLPYRLRTIRTTIRPAVFVTGSDIYASNTYYICMHSSENKLIKYNAIKDTQEVLLAGKAPEFVIQSFQVVYLATKKDVRVDVANFVPTTLTPSGPCVNAVYLTLTAKNMAPDATAIKDNKTMISRSRAVFATNLASRRPLNCIE